MSEVLDEDEREEEEEDRPRRFPILFIGSKLLQGNTRAILTIADWIKSLGISVHIYDKSDAPFIRYTEVRIGNVPVKMKITDRNSPSPVSFSIKDLQKYYYLPHMKPSDFSFIPMPSSYMGNETIEIPGLDYELRAGFFTGTEIFSHLPRHLRQVGTLYVHYPSFYPLGGWKRMLTNSEFTARRILEKWSVNATVLYPPVYNIYNPNRTKDIDFIIYSRLEKEKMIWALPFLESHHGRIVFVGRDQGYADVIRKAGGEVYTNAPLSQVRDLLERSKNYVHVMTFEDGGRTYGEHFGQESHKEN